MARRSRTSEVDAVPKQTRTRPGQAVGKDLMRLLPMKTKAEYDPDDIPRSDAVKAVDRARRIVEVARRITGATP